MVNYFELLGLSLLGGALGLGGGLILLYQKKWSTILEKNAIPYAAGVVITVALVGLIPEAMEMIDQAALWIVLAAFFSAYFFERLFVSIHHHGGEHHHHEHHHGSTAPLVLIGDTIHNFNSLLNFSA
jgi:zinc transporter ZupT